MVVGVVQEVLRALAGDLNHSRSVSRPLRSFFSFSFAFYRNNNNNMILCKF